MPTLIGIKRAIEDSVERVRVDLGHGFDDFRREVKVEFADIRALLQASHGDLDRRVTRLEKGR